MVTGTRVNPARHGEILCYAEAQFQSQWIALRDQHTRELKEARFGARQTNNLGAMLPAESTAYLAHTKSLTVARAKCVADAYTAFGETTGSEVSGFFSATVAARKASFLAEVELRQTRTRELCNRTQLTGLLRRFEHEASPALLEARAILARQRVEMAHWPPRPADAAVHVVDTNVFNWLADGFIRRDWLPSDAAFAITHIQVDEINQTGDSERRVRLLLTSWSLGCRLILAESFVQGVSRRDYSKQGAGRLFTCLKAELDLLNGGKKNNSRDALIAEVAIANGYTLLTADRDLHSATRRHGGKVVLFTRPQNESDNTISI